MGKLPRYINKYGIIYSKFWDEVYKETDEHGTFADGTRF